MSSQKKMNFQIEAFKHRVVVDPKYAEKTWKILEHAIHEIYNHNASGLSFEELYRNAYNMVLHKFGEKLYSGLVLTMTSHLKEIAVSIEAAQGALFLEELDRKWTEHNKALQMIRDILMYMDRTFIPSTHKTPVHELGLNLWRDNIVHTIKIQTRLKNTLLELVQKERGGDVINRGLMRNVVKMLMELGSSVYQEDFEKPFLAVSADFYRAESQLFIESCDCGDYLKKAEKRLNEEIERVSQYLDAKSEVKITNVVEKEMIESQMNRLVHMENSGLVSMLMDDKYEAMGPELGDGPTLVVHVLTTGSWPTQSTTACNLPSEILTVCDKFKTYYLGTHSGRRLTWQTNMGSADIKATFAKGQKHELNVSTYQMCVLMLFNNGDGLSYREIEQATEIPSLDLKRCLQSLACAKGKNVLRKEPMSKDIVEDDVFFFNDKFSSKFYKVKIGTVAAQKESEPEKQETRQRVEEDRKPQIEAAIVRIMKARRVLDHNNIVAEVTKQLQSRFLPNPVVIKKRIESLIEREFLERDKDDRKLYRYLA
ncbi:putative cullin protein, neddylation [Helianthus annuus]|nr:putative cullin protein, neddylation [Helianthus annuus]KAJ0447152.1 putative cullin protein, neddylation [Helianthus annuus]KAJ0632060.1 putative cullin protein, neddylation [Helianthus annuus]KAJ0635941.1 putative cullin protein, neddylation [Helianthus annuus]